MRSRKSLLAETGLIFNCQPSQFSPTARWHTEESHNETTALCGRTSQCVTPYFIGKKVNGIQETWIHNHQEEENTKWESWEKRLPKMEKLHHPVFRTGVWSMVINFKAEKIWFRDWCFFQHNPIHSFKLYQNYPYLQMSEQVSLVLKWALSVFK